MAFTVIDHTEFSSGAVYWEEGSISSSYSALVLKASVRSDYSDYMVHCHLQVGNGSVDTGSNYSQSALYAKLYAPEAARDTSRSNLSYIYGSGASAGADCFGSIEIWFPSYSNTSNWKQIITRSVGENTDTTVNRWILSTTAGLWKATSAIDTVRLSVLDGSPDDFVQYSTFTLYGLTNDA